MCMACGLVPVYRLAEMYARRAIEAAECLKCPSTRAWVQVLTGSYYLGIGRWAEARENLEGAVKLARELGDWRRWEEASGELARLDFYVGRFEDGERRFREFGDEARRRNHGQALAWGHHGQSKILIRMGRSPEALASLEESLTLPAEVVGIGDALLRAGLLAEAHMALGDWAAARKAADEALRLIQRNPPIVSYTLEGYAGAAETFLALWESSDLGPFHPSRKQLADSARGAVAGLGRLARVYPVAAPRAWLLKGTARWLSGRRGSARRAWRKSLQAAERLSMPLEIALALGEIGRHLEPEDPARRERLAQAIEIFERLGARDEASRARASTARRFESTKT